ncbi:unnamed protein product [Oreochromis niloticus]|nr:unnamed protein product [Mustela putorius furo]
MCVANVCFSRSACRGFSRDGQEAADRELCEMMKAGIIEPSDSPWASAVVMVPKKNSPRMRFCVDYRPLNKVTKKDSYPLPRIDESLDLVAGSSWFSTLDLRSGYWQVPLSPESRPKTAFCTNRGLWQFKVLSFGLCNAPATFERLMDSVLAGVPRQRCLVYLDDLLVHGSSFDAALDALRQVLGRVAAAGLKLHPDKCHFMRREVEFLGHKLGQEGIGTLEEKIHTITEWPTPADQKQLKSFLGLASYYRREPEGQVARWLEELQAFNFTVEHRAGTHHSNADALSLRPCAAAGCRYCEKREETERELTTMDGATQLTCRALLVVDAAEWRARQEQDTDLLPVLQWLEREERPLWDEVTGFSICTRGLWAKFTALRLKEGVLERAWKDPATGEERWQVVVPRSLRSAVLEACHGSTGSGHFGVSKTLRRLRQGYYWGQQRRDVEDFCRSCDACSSHKGPQDQSRAQLQQQPAGAPMERVAVDVMGPFPRTDRGNRYVLVAMDYFTKWPEAYAIPDQEAETVADVLVEGMFSRFGTAETLHSDQGRNFESKVFAAMCERLGIKKTRTTPLHPQSDGLVERFNRTLAQQLAILTSEHQQDWDYHLPLILMAYRSAVQDSTQCTPALLMLGRELRTPAELAFGKPPDAPEAPPGRDYARRLQDRLDSAHSYAREQLAKAGLRQKRNYDITTKGRHFRAGELVWVYSPKRKKGRCPKLDSSWVGPCSVLERVGEVVYRVQLPPRGRKVALHRDRMAPYRGQSLPSFPEGRVQSSHDPAQRDPRPELRSPPSDSPPQSPEAPCTPQGLRRSRREQVGLLTLAIMERDIWRLEQAVEESIRCLGSWRSRREEASGHVSPPTGPDGSSAPRRRPVASDARAMLHGLPLSTDTPSPRQRAVMPATPAKVPKYNRLTPLEPYLSQVAEEKIREMAAAGVIEPSNSPWAAPVVLVGKKDGSPRFCVDFRRLNAVTKKDSCPLPWIDEALDYVTGSSWFSSLDLRSGYWQVELAPEARPKTAFTIGQGLWQFRVMPFGLCNAPATFDRLMERVLVNIPRSRCVVYLDDLLVHGGDFDSALSHLSELKEALTRAPVLAYPDARQPFIVDTDASNVGVGAVLSQQGEAGERVVAAYFSRALGRAERNYCVTRRELLAVVLALLTPVDLVFGSPPEPEIDGGPEMDYYRRLRERLQVVHDYTRQAQASAGVRQKRAYDTKCRGEAFVPGDKVWVYCPVRKRGVSPKLCSHWQGPAEVLERLTEVVYRIRMPGPGRMVVLHRDRLSAYRPLTPADAGAGDAGDTPGSDPSDFSPAGRDRPARQKKASGHLQDFVWGNGAVGDD